MGNKRMRNLVSAVLAAFFGALLGVAAPANNLTTTVTLGAKKLDMSLQFLDVSGKELETIPVNKMMQLRVKCKNCDGPTGKQLSLSSFDAQMPAHRHGMVTRPRITVLESGVFLIEGVKFQMPGVWEMTLQWSLDKQAAQVVIPLKL